MTEFNPASFNAWLDTLDEMSNLKEFSKDVQSNYDEIPWGILVQDDAAQ